MIYSLVDIPPDYVYRAIRRLYTSSKGDVTLKLTLEQFRCLEKQKVNPVNYKDFTVLGFKVLI